VEKFIVSAAEIVFIVMGMILAVMAVLIAT
jgi:hypothetical protein